MQMYQTMIEEEEVPEPKDSTQIAQLVSEGWMEGWMEGGRGRGREEGDNCLRSSESILEWIQVCV